MHPADDGHQYVGLGLAEAGAEEELLPAAELELHRSNPAVADEAAARADAEDGFDVQERHADW